MDRAPALAAEHLAGLGRRWEHVQAVGRLADRLVAAHAVPTEVAAAAWLHDIGYAPELAATGFHPLDGALFLARQGVPDEVVALVAHHTGAAQEAEERGFAAELAAMPRPERDALDVLTLLDLVTGPGGTPTDPAARIAEILSRYEPSDPVHRAVLRSREDMLASAECARSRLGLADEWPVGVLERVG